MRIGGPAEPVEVTVDASPAEQYVKVRARVRVGEVEVGPVQAELAPRIARPGDDPPSEQTTGHPDDRMTRIAPANVSVRPRVASAGDDRDRRQRNESPSQAAAVNADVSPRILSDGDSGDREQRNGSAESPPREQAPLPGDAPEGPGPVPLLVAVLEPLRTRPGRRGWLDIVSLNADVSPRLASNGSDGDRAQRNGYDGAGTANDEMLDDNQLGAVNLVIAPDLLSDGHDGAVSQWNGSHDPQAASGENGDVGTGTGNQVLSDNQVAAVNAALVTDVASNGGGGGVTQHNGSDDDESAGVVNSGGPGGDATTGSGDQVLTDDEIVVANLIAGGQIGGSGDSGDTRQHNGSDDDQAATTANGPGSDGEARTGEGDQTLTDVQALPVNGHLAPDAGSTGNDGSVTQHNGSDDDQVAIVSNAGPAGGDGAAGAGGQELTDDTAVPATAAADPNVGGSGTDGATTQQNGSDDDQLVAVTNGPGSPGNGAAGTGPQARSDSALVPLATPAADMGTTDDVRVLVTNTPAAPAHEVLSERRRSEIANRRARRRSVVAERNGGASPGSPGGSLHVLGVRAGNLPRTGAEPLQLGLMGLLAAGLGIMGRRRTRAKGAGPARG